MAVRAQSGFAPAWNFNKILIGGDGQVLATWGAATRPLSQKLTHAIEAELDKHRP
jgi:glutathione peroxidase